MPLNKSKQVIKEILDLNQKDRFKNQINKYILFIK